MPAFTITLARAVVAGMLLAAPLSGLAAKRMTQDEALLAARDAFAAGDRGKLARLAGNLQGHPLESYVEYWQLRLRLEEASDDDVRAFLARNAGTVLAEQLRRDWLRVLGKAGKREVFGAEYPLLAGDDPELVCYALKARWERGDESVAAELQSFWIAPRELPEGCAAVAAAMLQSGRLGARDLWARFRVLADADSLSAAARLAAFLPRDQALQATRIKTVAQAPLKYLGTLRADLRNTAERELAILALARAAHADPRLAVSYWEGRLRRSFSPEDQGYVWGMLATNGARRHLPAALDWFREAGAAALSDEQLAWWVRIALRQGNWPEVRNAVGRMSAPAQNDPAWIYWLGRAQRALGNAAAAQTQFGRIAGEHHFYARLAAEELGVNFQVPPKASAPTDEEIAETGRLPGLQRSLALYRADLRVEGTREWIWSIRGMDDRRLLAAAELARRNRIWDRAINTADKTVSAHDFSIRYLAPYRDVLAQQARARELDEPLVLGLVRQESRFIADAHSSAGASGLMQLMRSTARWVARKIGMKNFSVERISDPDVNAMLGTYYLRHVLDKLDGSAVLAAAAYNAGPGRARKWQDAAPLEGAIYAESIPFSETRDYVKKVLVNTVYYAAVLGGRAATLKARLGTVPARAANGGAMAMEDEPAP